MYVQVCESVKGACMVFWRHGRGYLRVSCFFFCVEGSAVLRPELDMCSVIFFVCLFLSWGLQSRRECLTHFYSYQLGQPVVPSTVCDSNLSAH